MPELNNMEQIEELDNKGFSIVSNCFTNEEMSSISNCISNLILREAEKIDGETFEKIKKLQKEDLPHEGLLILKNVGDEYMRHVVDELNSSAVFLKFLTNDKLLKWGKYFTKSTNPEDLIFAYARFRVDLPSEYKVEENKFSLPWHQESGYFHTNVCKKTGVVLNVPLYDCNKNDGCLRMKVGSNIEGYVKHEEHYEDENNKKHLRAIVPKKYLEKYNEEIFAETKSGDLLVGHFNTFHISGINSSKKVRYTMLVRASNIMGPNFLV